MFKINFLILVNVVLSLNVYAADFVAQAWQYLPQQNTSQSSLLYLADDKRMRIESHQNSRPVVQIINPILGRNWVIFTKEATYMENILPAMDGKRQDIPEICILQIELNCEYLQEEQINGRTTKKYKIMHDQQGESHISYQWIDIEHNFPIRQELSQGWISEAYLIDEEVINARDTEKWQFINISPQGDKQVSYQWYDPELNINIKEEFPGGMVRELKDIEIKPLKDELFLLPQGLRKIQFNNVP